MKEPFRVMLIDQEAMLVEGEDAVGIDQSCYDYLCADVEAACKKLEQLKHLVQQLLSFRLTGIHAQVAIVNLCVKYRQVVRLKASCRHYQSLAAIFLLLSVRLLELRLIFLLRSESLAADLLLEIVTSLARVS